MISIAVTQQHIDEACDSSTHDRREGNPISRATCEFYGVKVGEFSTNISIGSIKHEKSGRIATLPEEALVKLRKWDLSREMEPFSFTMEMNLEE